MKSGNFVYFIKPVGMAGPIKIGCSDCPETRLEALASWSPLRLEIIGRVPGTLKDEKFLHECFVEDYSHREWFHASEGLRSAINQILQAGSIDVVRSTLVRKGALPRKPRKQASDSEKLRRSYARRIDKACRGLRKAEEYSAWDSPPDVYAIMGRWDRGSHPTEAEFARIHEYLDNPRDHSVIPAFRRRVNKDPICIPVFGQDAEAA